MDEKEVFEDKMVIIPGNLAYPMQQIANATGTTLEEMINEFLAEYIKLTNNFIISNENMME